MDKNKNEFLEMQKFLKSVSYAVRAGILMLILAACGGQEDAVPTAPSGSDSPGGEPETAVVETDVSIDGIIGIVWQWESFQDTAGENDINVPDPAQYTLTLRPGGVAQIQADCNQVQWTYTAEGNSLAFNTLGPSTLAFCGENSLDQDYLAKLGAAATFVMSEGKLVLNLMADSGNMIFTNGGPASPEIGAGAGKGFCDLVNPTWISLNTAGLNYSWQANCVPATPYDQSQPPGPKGLPEHIEINFGVVDPADKQPGDPVIYIIPANAYEVQWQLNDNDMITRIMDDQKAMLTGQPLPFASTGILPAEEVGGVLDLSVQQKYLAFENWGGFRFVGRFSQDANPVTNQGLRYIFQGYAGENDDIFVAMFWPVETPFLSRDAGSLPQEEWDAFNADMNAYMTAKSAMLNMLAAEDWLPPLTVLDGLLASIEYGDPQAPEPIPTVIVPTPEPEVAYGRVIAPSGVYVRTGPGSNYPILATAPFGTEGVITGRSADGLWWVTPIQGAPNNQGWVAAAYVQAFNAENVPAIPAPPPPVPTATPTPLPTPAPSINFWADQTTIEQGQCTTLRWDVDNIQAVWVYPQGQDYAKYPTTGQGSQQVCPTQTTTYEMRVQLRNGSVEFRQVTISVNQSNPLVNTSWTLDAMNVNGAPIPGTTITLLLGPGGAMSGNGGCNSYSGSYSVGGDNIRFGNVTSTKLSCGEEINGQEQMYLTLLQSALSYQLSGNQLILFGGGGVEILRFTRTN